MYISLVMQVLMEANAPREHAIAAILTHITTSDIEQLPPAESVTIELATLPIIPVPLIKKAIIIGAVTVSILSIYAAAHSSRDKSATLKLTR
jgi:hypothetical protein